MHVYWWLPLAALASLVANSATSGILNREGSDPPSKPTATDGEYSVFVGRWTECVATSPNGDRLLPIDSVQPEGAEAESLVHTPRLGLQRRQLQCRARDGSFVEPTYCGKNMEGVGSVRVCVVREDCRLGEWLPWRPRPDGALVRTRRLRRLPQGGGKECGVVEEVRPAVLEPGARWAPGPWGPCAVAADQPATAPPPAQVDDDGDDADDIYPDSAETDPEGERGAPASCGGGVQRREASCARADGRRLHPAHCAHVPLPTLVQPCEIPCPRDCEVGEWSEWGACQPTDECPLSPVQLLTSAGYSVRRRRVVSAASGGGAPCPPLEEKRSCATPRCAVWRALPWGPCVLDRIHGTCGGGRRTRELLCVTHDGKEAEHTWCAGQSAGPPARSERCRIACAGDCVVSAWGPWQPCSAPCAGAGPPPTTARRRHILAHAAPGGWPCPPEDKLVQNETCNTHACATYSWLAAPWGPCERKKQDFLPPSNYTILDDGPLDPADESEPCVEEGEMTRDVMCVQNNADVVREALCAPLQRPAARRACTVRCHRGCRVEAWSPWSPCPNTCEGGKQVRTRRVHGGPNCGPLQEARECPAPASCRARAAWVAGPWHTCRLPPRERCGHGYRVRSIWCGSESQRVGAGACAGQALPRSVAPCRVQCAPHDAPLTCDDVCRDPLKYLDAAEPDIPTCVCKNVSLEPLPTDSDCILPLGMECGEGRSLRAARCLVGHRVVPMDVCKKYHPLTGPRRVREASTDGLQYDEEFPSLLKGPCSVRCPRDCAAAAWGPWGPCAPEPGSRAAFRFRTREVVEEGSGGGRECGATLQRATCREPAPRWRAAPWPPCAPPRALCGRALLARQVSCVDAEGKELPDSVCETAGVGSAPPRETACRAPCPADCVVSTWSDWSPCQQTKWGGRRDRTRVVLRPAQEGGAGCPHLVAAEPCSPHTYSWHVAPWDDCQPLGGSPCGEGVKRRDVRCLRSDGLFVNDSFCPNKTSAEASESWCYVACGVDCALGEWGAWDASACACGGASGPRHMRRIRQRLVASVWPGRACPAAEQRAPCPREPCLRPVARPLPGCHIQTDRGESSVGVCGAGARVSLARCELGGGAPDDADAYLEPWRCALALPGRIVAPPAHYQEEAPCSAECGCSGVAAPAGPWSGWGPCCGGARARTRQLVAAPSRACPSPARYVTIEWANCTEGEEIVDGSEPRGRGRRPTASPGSLYPDGYTEGSNSLLTAVWSATILLTLYGIAMLYLAFLRCLRSKRMKTITKV